MAEPKVQLLVVHSAAVEERPHCIIIWTDNPARDFVKIKRIEGANTVMMLIRVCVDPRYDPQEMAEEIRELLAAEVPDVFKEK